MENFNLVLKILAVVAVVAGIIFVVVAYGDKIADFFTKLFRKSKKTKCEDPDFVDDSDLEDGEIVAGDQDFEG